jgi:hypothetical protein
MSHCKHKGCTAESLDDSVYCGAHQLVTGKVRQRVTRGGDDPSQAPNDDRPLTGNPGTEAPRNPGHRDGNTGNRGRTRGG